MTRFIDINKTKSEKITLAESGKYVVFFYNYSGNVEVEIQNKGIDVEILGLFIGRDSSHFDIHTVQHHEVGESQSNLLVHGIFFDKSYFDYSGLIKIDKDAQLTHSYQKNQNIIMSDAVHVGSDPSLEIEANDVFCTHGSTTGELSKDQLYYLANRGIAKKKAEELLLHGFAKKIFSLVKFYGFEREVATYEKEARKLLETI